MIDSITRELGSWCFISKEFYGLSISDFLRDGVSSISSCPPREDVVAGSWTPPPLGILKLNFDSASKGNPGPAGLGSVVRECNWAVLRACVGPFEYCDSLKTELFGLLMSLRDLHNIDVSKIIIEGNSVVVIGWAKGNGSCIWRNSHLIHEIKDRLDRLDCSVCHVLRCRNKLANSLANWGVG